MFLGLDLGTSGLKAVLIDERQRLVGEAAAPLSVARPASGWSEQEPDDWITAAGAALDALAADHPREMAAVRGIGLSGQMHGATVLDQSDRPLRPAILWNDTRAWREAAELDADPRFRDVTGNIVFPGFTAPKLVWMARNEPALFERARRVLLPKDYLRLWLTGEALSDMSDSAGTAWLDTGARRWSTDLLAACGLGIEQMPGLVEGSAPGGRLRDTLASRWGIPAGAVIAGGAGDNAASAIGLGAVADGAAFASLGTSGVLFAANARYAPNPASAVHAFCHAVPGTWHQMGVILSATDCLNWLSGLTGASPSTLTGEVGEALEAPSGVQFLPYLSGERTPHNDAAIRGALVGLSHSADRREVTQAVMEGVAFALADCSHALADAGTRLDRLAAVGGGSRSRLWLRIIATVLDCPVDVPADGDFGAAFGAARLGLIAATGADPLSVATPPAIAWTAEPDSRLTDAYREAHARYRSLYPAIRSATVVS